ncbi:MAG: FAD:protein FMN transferase [Acidimicrobiales bacterium]
MSREAADPGPEPVLKRRAGGPGELVHAEEVMGTVVSFRVVRGPVPVPAAQAAVADACRALHEVDRVFSTWHPGSPLSRFRRGESTWEELPDEVAAIAEECAAAKTSTDGWFDAGALPGGFDPTGLVKGWAVERAVDMVAASGAPGGIVNAGGDLAVWGEPAPGERWNVAMRHPAHPDAAAGIVRVTAAIATSGEYERGAHLWDPFAARHACRVASATVTGPRLVTADALATALAVAGSPGLAFVARTESYEGFVVEPDGTGRATPGFVAQMVDP